MVALSLSLLSSRNASAASLSRASLKSLKQKDPVADARVATPALASASSSSESLDSYDDENVTITANRKPVDGAEQELDDLRLLAISTRITELSYSISDIQTRIFEIQELRHQAQAGAAPASATPVIDQALMGLDARLEDVARGMAEVGAAVAPLSACADRTPRAADIPRGDGGERALLVRKHVALAGEWDAVQDESDVLREELKEDKWLTVFRTVSEQADGMMSSLEKAVKRCQDFIWQVHRGAPSEEGLPLSSAAQETSINYETYRTLLDSFEAKKKHYVPATSKVLSIIDKGVQDRVTKNGECLRRHAESTQRWRNLRERMARVDAEMEGARKILLARDAELSETGSNASAHMSRSSAARTGLLATPPASEPARSRAPSSTSSTLSRSISPLRKFARRFAGSKTPTPTPPAAGRDAPRSEPQPTLRHRQSYFPFRAAQAVTPERPTHKHSQSLTPESSPGTLRVNPPRWNSSTKVGSDDGSATVKPTPPRRPSAAAVHARGAEVIPPVPPLPPRSVSRVSSVSSRPWSPVTPSVASTANSYFSTPGRSRPPSRAQSPGSSVARTRSGQSAQRLGISSGHSDASFDNESEPSSLMQRAFSPTLSVSAASAASALPRAHTPGGSVYVPSPRPPSRSMIPIPSFRVSRPGSAMSAYERSTTSMSTYDRSTTSMSFRSAARGAQTPEPALRARVSKIPFFADPPAQGGRRPALGKLPPSSFRDAGSTASLPRTPLASRPGSRADAVTPGPDGPVLPRYAANMVDPLDVAVATAVNGGAHGLLVERVDPPLRRAPREGEEMRAQYAFANTFARKIVTCRLATTTRIGARGQSPVTTRKVMCRVGGGWQDLQIYMLNRQAGT